MTETSLLLRRPSRRNHFDARRDMKPLIVPLVAGIIAVVGCYRLNLTPTFTDHAALLGFAGSITSVASTMLGFMLAALAVIASINNSQLLQTMKTTGHYDDLLETILSGCLLFLAIALLGFALLFGATANKHLLATLIGLHAAALISLLDVGRKFWLVLKNVKST